MKQNNNTLSLHIFLFDFFSNNFIFVESSPFFKRGFIVNNATTFAMHEVHSANGQSHQYVYVHILSSIIETFAVDAKSDIVYFVDSGNSVLKKHDLRSRQTHVLTSISSAQGINS